MPYPILLAAAATALTVAGAGMQVAGSQQSRSAEDAALAAEQARQRGYQQEATAVAQKSISQSAPDVAESQINKGASDRQAAYNTVGAALAASGAGARPPVKSQQVSAPADRGQAQADATASAWSKLGGAAQARMGGYQDWGLAQEIKNRQAAAKIGEQTNFARGSAALLPIEMRVASHAGDEVSGWGSLVSALGAAGMMGAAVAPGAAAAAGIGVADTSLAVPADFNFTPVGGALPAAAVPDQYAAWSNIALPAGAGAPNFYERN